MSDEYDREDALADAERDRIDNCIDKYLTDDDVYNALVTVAEHTFKEGLVVLSRKIEDLIEEYRAKHEADALEWCEPPDEH